MSISSSIEGQDFKIPKTSLLTFERFVLASGAVNRIINKYKMNGPSR